jgi:hypothetical protein
VAVRVICGGTIERTMPAAAAQGGAAGFARRCLQ